MLRQCIDGVAPTLYRVGAMERPNLVGDWLRSTRERQVMPGTEDPWTQDYFLDRLREKVGWAPERSNYSKYENGKQWPKPATLTKFVAFWASRGEPGPDLTPPRPVPVLDPYDVLDRHAKAMEAQALAFNRLAVSIDQAADRMTARIEDSVGAFADVVAALRTLLPTDEAGSPDANAHGR